ncbi:MAG: hypothetical protein ACKVOR_02140 [Flavobacteriales bacterium]
MKYIITIFIASAFAMLSFNTAEQMEFYDFFKYTYSQSFEGLVKLKNEKGEWTYTNSVSGFDKCSLAYNKERKVNEMTITKTHTAEADSKSMMADLEKSLNTMLPEWQYKRTTIKNQDGTQSIVYGYISTSAAERDQYPSVELDVVKSNNNYELCVRLFEPKALRK